MTYRTKTGSATPRSMKVLQEVAAVALASLPWLAIPPAASAVTVPHALVLSARATPSALGPSGGQVRVTGKVRHAASCQLELLSRQSFPVVYSEVVPVLVEVEVAVPRLTPAIW
jgi:hypothetical protein